MKPYFDDGQIQIYHGDARDILPVLPRSYQPIDVIITDPVWPNATPELAGSDDPARLFREAAQYFGTITDRLVVQLGCDSDPRFLRAVPKSFPFFRVCWLEYVRPHYKGRLLYTSDVAYVFGTPPASRDGAHVLPGKTLQNDAQRRMAGHPCARQPQHVRWLVNWFARGRVLDPFCGSGTTLEAARACGLPAIGIEISEAYCALAVERLELQGVFDLTPARAAGREEG